MNKKINLAIIGGSYDSTIAKTHLRSLLSTRKYEIVCSCPSENKNKNKKNSQFYLLPENKIYNDIQKLIYYEKKKIDLALVLTPPNVRYRIYQQLAINNIGIISEKPFEGNLQKAKKIYKLINNKKIFFTSTYSYLGYPAIMEIKPLLKKIGSIKNFVLEMPQEASTLENAKMKLWRTKDKTIPNLHLDLASHLLSLIIYFFNELPLKVNSLEKKNLKYVDNAYTWLKFKNFIGQLWFSKNSPGNKNELSIRIFGSKGSIEWAHKKHEEIILSDNNGNKHYISRRSKNTKYLKNDKYFTYSAGHPGGFLDSFINIYEEIYKVYKNKKNKNPSILMTLKDNLKIILILEKIHRSSIKESWQNII